MSNPVPPAARPAVDPFESVDADLELLETLDPAGQVPVFGRIHAALTDALAATAGTAGAATPGRPPGGGR
ncbi:hypothetical protein [Nakamurella deserti]|uniref:hypothetical protein n=1 Tax=Nakamurella deserti TaxID=2164074 RepID=UPI000DBE64B3|nr:hypothetical protein [Nakamurella deserti]